MMSTRGGRIRGPGPVFIYEWITSTRRWQTYALRSAFVLGLLIALLVMGLSREADVHARGLTSLRALAQLGESLFVAVIGTQLTLVLLVAPAATAGAICLDRSRGTLAHLLVTDLTDREIVLGKLAARLTPVLVLIAATLPVMELLTLLGGVDPDALLGAFFVMLGVAVLGACLALVFSIWLRRTHEVLLATYAVWGLWLLGRPMLDQFNRATGLSLSRPPEFADPYRLAFAPYWQRGSVEWPDYLSFLGTTLAISALLALIAVVTMRRSCTWEASRPRRSSGRAAPSRNGPSRIFGRIGPTLDANPVLWREWHRNRPARWMRIIAGVFGVLALVFSLMAMLGPRGSDLPPWVNALQVSIGLLFLSVIAATSLAEERVRGSLDVLLTTPLPTWQIVIGKWLGTYRFVPPLAVLPVAVIAVGGSGDERWPAAILTFAFMLSSGAAIASFGLALATWCPRLGRAVGLTITLYVLVTVGLMLAIMATSRDPIDRTPLIWASPFFWAAAMTEGAYLKLYERVWAGAVGSAMAHAVTAGALLAATLATFDRCLGRVQVHSPRQPEPRSERGRAGLRRAEA
jgi:ABC-type transport system involved in multi-copper enzyme maturation permease subunit